MQLCCICDGFYQPKVQALCCQEEAFTDEVVARGIASSTGAIASCMEAIRNRAGAVAAGSALLRCPALLKVGPLLFRFHVQLCCIFKADALVVGRIPANTCATSNV